MVKRNALLSVYPEVPLIEARKKKTDIKVELKEGKNPLLSRLEKAQTQIYADSQTFEAVAMEWYATQLDHWDPRYAKTVLHRLEKYVFIEIGNYPINALKPLLLLSCLQKIEKTAPEMARRVKQLCSHIFKYAIVTNRIEHDVTYGLECALKKFKRGHFAALSVDELPEFLNTLHNHKARLSRQTYLAIRLMFLTFVRTGELVEAKWTEIDLDKAMWIIPAERMKMGSEHMVPLAKQSIAILKELKEMNGKREFVFPSLPRPKKSISKGTILMALKRMGYKNRMTGHGFRSLALGILKEKLQLSHEVADRQLAHVPKNGTDRAYDRAKFLPQRSMMMQQYADYLDKVYTQFVIT